VNPAEAMYWTQVEALIWVFTRDEGAVQLAADHLRRHDTRLTDLPNDEPPGDSELIGLAVMNRRKAHDLSFEAFEDAEDAVVEALSSDQPDRLQAWAYRNGRGDREEIPDSQWGAAGLQFYWDDPEYGTHVGPRDQSRLDAARWTGVIFRRQQVLMRWPPLRRPRVARNELRRWLVEHHTQRQASDLPPTERDDFDEARKEFPGVSRDLVRQERRALLPLGPLRRPGRRAR
jgi:hypothetical protein